MTDTDKETNGVESIDKGIDKNEDGQYKKKNPNNGDLISRIDEYLSFMEHRVYEDDQTLYEERKEIIEDYIEFGKFFLTDGKIERIFELMYEETGEEMTPLDAKIVSYLNKINKMAMRMNEKTDQLILMGMKSIILAGALSADDSRQEKIITKGISLKTLLS